MAPDRTAQGDALLALYDDALPHVYGYLVRRCEPAVADDLTAETFMAAVDAIEKDRVPDLTIAWLVRVARNKLVDHWRAEERDRRRTDRLANEAHVDHGASGDEEWDVVLDVVRAHATLGRLAPHHRTVLTLRYLDGLGVPEVATELGRTVHATEALLVRARRMFRRAYEGDRDAG